MVKVGHSDWKDKYLRSLERLEEAEKQAEQRLDILRKGFVRVSLAADGLDEPLDDVLADLRKALRESDDVLLLEPMITRLESCVVALDDHRKDDYGVASEMIDGSLQAASELGFSRKDKSVIKSFRKKLPGLLRGGSVNLELWKGYLETQQPIYNYVESLEQERLSKKPSGLFQRLFSGGNDNSENGDPANTTVENPETDVDTDDAADCVESIGSVEATNENSTENITNNSSENITENSEIASDDVSGAVVSGNSVGSVNPSDVALDDVASDNDKAGVDEDLQREELKSRTIQVFCGLVDQIETPDEFDIRKSDLVVRLQNEFDWQWLPDLLNEAMELVASTRKVTQLEFEGFLVTLHDRLQNIQDFLQVARQGEEQAQLNQIKLDENVRDGLKEIKASVDDALDIGVLKQDITSMVNQIVDVIDVFHKEERDRRDDVYDRIEMLGEKMAEMEAEATELRNSLETQRMQAMRDPLTELPNRQAYDEQVKKEYSRWKRHDRSLSMAIADIDHFKSVNDNLGHLRGDKVLKLVAREIQKNIRNEDFVARYGGEEFVILMPDTDEDSALLAVEKIRAAIECCPFNFAGERVSITASFGVSQLNADDTILSCFDRIDKALYKAKGNGRNRVERG